MPLESIPASVRFRVPPGLVVERQGDSGAGGVVLSFPLSEPPLRPHLTPVEQEILRDLAHGLSNGEIACRRGVSIRTVANQLAHLFRKLGVHSRLEATRMAGHWTRAPLRAEITP